MEQAFPHAIEPEKPEGLVERDGARLGVSDHADTADKVSLGEREAKDVTDECLADAKALGASVDPEPREPKDGEGVVWETLAELRGRQATTLQACTRDGGIPEQFALPDRDPGDGEVEPELVLASVVLEEPVDGWFAAGEGAAVVLAPEEADLEVSHASAR